MRIDDIDPYRTVRGAADRIQYTLDALGLRWDGPVLFQGSRSERYRAAVDELESRKLVYSCTCSRKDLTDSHNTTTVYPGFCRHRSILSRREPHALRILTAGTEISFHDQIQGRIEQNVEMEVGDFILFRRDQVYAYHLATVLDDAEQGITEVLRGFDLLDSTPRQIFLQRCLGLPVPGYTHIPILVDRTGQKLSKQSFAPEAETRHPGGLLFHLLVLLQQDPPAELASAPAPEILEWAVAHWDLSRLIGLKRITVDPSQFQP